MKKKYLMEKVIRKVFLSLYRSSVPEKGMSESDYHMPLVSLPGMTDRDVPMGYQGKPLLL